MNNRRNFIRNGLLLAGAAGLTGKSLLGAAAFQPESAHMPLPAEGGKPGEDYWKLLRAQFPLSKDRIFLNNGTVGPSPYAVLHEVQQDMLEVDSSGRYGGHEETAIKALAGFLNTSETEISLMRNVTEGINVVCWGLPLKAGDEVIMTGHEHVGHAAPWLNRVKLHGITVKILKLGKTASETIDNLMPLLGKKTKVISVPHIPCTIGQILPVKEICSIARARGIYSFLDGAHPPGMLKTDLKDIGCDMYAGCCHKWMLGPKGTGFLYVSEAMRDTVQVYYGGGGFDTGWDMLSNPPALKGYVASGHRYYYGTQNPSLLKGVVKAIEFQNAVGREHIENRIRTLATYLQEELLKLSSDIEMLTPVEDISRGAQVAFRIRNREVSRLQTQCGEKKIITRYVPENNINCLRISTHIYNSYEDINSFLQETDKFLKA